MRLANFLEVPWRAIPRFCDLGPDMEIRDRATAKASILCTVVLPVEGVQKETYVCILDDMPIELAEHIAAAHNDAFK
jgi:hypothetical protein